MTLPASGTIKLSQVNTELGLSASAQINMGRSDVRNLFGKASGTIKMSDGYGKSLILPLISSGLVFHLDAGNTSSYSGSGTAWNDLTGNNNATLVNSPTFNTTFGKYFSFNGTNQEVTTSITHAGINSTSFTFFGWFRTSTASGRKIIGFQNNQTGTAVSSYDKHVYVSTAGKLVFGVYNGSTQTITSSATVSDGVWHSFAAVYNNSGNDELFIDGISQGTMNVTSTDTEAYIRIAGYALTGWPNASSGYFTGDIAVLARYNRALSAAEALQNHNNMKARFGL